MQTGEMSGEVDRRTTWELSVSIFFLSFFLFFPSFFSMPALWDGGVSCVEAAASYLAVHEFQVDSFQRDLQQAAFPALHVLHRELPAQLWTCSKIRLRC